MENGAGRHWGTSPRGRFSSFEGGPGTRKFLGNATARHTLALRRAFPARIHARKGPGRFRAADAPAPIGAATATVEPIAEMGLTTVNVLGTRFALPRFDLVRVHTFFLQTVCRLLAFTVFRLKIVGRENIPSRGPAVLVCNHVSYVDWLILTAAFRPVIRFIMHHSFFHVPVLRRIFKDAKVIPIASGLESPALLEASFERIAGELEKGEIVCVFPEGRLTRTGNTISFRPGVERIVRTTPVPVIPLCLNGLWGSYFSRKYGKPMSTKPFRRSWARTLLVVGKSLPPGEVTAPGLRRIVDSMKVD